MGLGTGIEPDGIGDDPGSEDQLRTPPPDDSPNRAPQLHRPPPEDPYTEQFGEETFQFPYQCFRDGSAEAQRWIERTQRDTEEHVVPREQREQALRHVHTVWEKIHDMEAPVVTRNGTRLVFTERTGDSLRPILCIQDRGSQTRTLLDPLSHDKRRGLPEGVSHIHNFTVSANGRYAAAIVVSRGTISDTALFVIDCNNGQVLNRHKPRPLPLRVPSLSFHRDSRGQHWLFYSAPGVPIQKGGESENRVSQIMLHRVGTDHSKDCQIDIPQLYDHERRHALIVTPEISGDQQHLFVNVRAGSVFEGTIYSATLRGASNLVRHALSRPGSTVSREGDFHKLLDGPPSISTYAGHSGKTHFFCTNRDTPLGSFSALRFDEDTGVWTPLQVFAGNEDRLLIGATVAGNQLATHYLHEGQSGIKRFHLAFDGDQVYLTPSSPVELPPSCFTERLSFQGGSLYMGIETYGNRSRPHKIGPGQKSIEQLVDHGFENHLQSRRLTGEVDIEVRRICCTESGREVPINLVYDKRYPPEKARALIITPYGGYGLFRRPQAFSLYRIFTQAGYVVAVPELSGDGNAGHAESIASRGANKIRTVDEVIAATKKLREFGRPVVCNGVSHGGLMGLLAATHNPSAFDALCVLAPSVRLGKGGKDIAGVSWEEIQQGESGLVESEAAFLRRLSPLHALKHGIAMPPTLAIVGNADDRTPAMATAEYMATLMHHDRDIIPEKPRHGLIVLPTIGHAKMPKPTLQEVEGLILAFFDKHLPASSSG